MMTVLLSTQLLWWMSVNERKIACILSLIFVLHNEIDSIQYYSTFYIRESEIDD